MESSRASAGVKMSVLPLQLAVPGTLGARRTAPAAPSASTGSLKATSMLVVMSARFGSPATGWVTAMLSTTGGRASTVLAT